jgi:hypothetical protein
VREETETVSRRGGDAAAGQARNCVIGDVSCGKMAERKFAVGRKETKTVSRGGGNAARGQPGNCFIGDISRGKLAKLLCAIVRKGKGISKNKIQKG